MPDIRAVQSLAVMNRTEKRVERNTVNLEGWLRLTVNEIRRLRLGDVNPGDEDVLQ